MHLKLDELSRAIKGARNRLVRLEQLLVGEGDQIVAGATIARLERSELIAQRDAARAQYEGAQAVLSELKAGSREESLRHVPHSLLQPNAAKPLGATSTALRRSQNNPW